ncbi:MAG TPA: hypothetical protein VKY85_20645 [Candidatus Angelobacter sp.]|nr:hypothetical protein [Candidatus Angelobacter sp.]
MNEDRRQILEMLSAGKITTDEAERLIAALEKGPAATASASDSGSKARPKYLRVMVEDQSERMGKGKTQVNVRVPMQLLRAGVRLASLIPSPALNHANEALHEQGIQLDLSQLKPENLEELVDQLADLTVDVDEEKTKVRVFCE